METNNNQAKLSDSLDDSLTNIQWLYRLDTPPDNLHGHKTITLNTAKTKRKDKMAEESDKSDKEAETSPKNPHPKPPYSYSTLILLAINSSPEKKMTLQQIYKWIEQNFPYFEKCKKAWKNSIRHNLSLHSFFIKELRPSSLPGKGNFWCLSSEGKNNIVKEVIKHSQPLLQIPYKIQTSAKISAGGLRPILPKPSLDNSASLSAGGIMGNIGILANGVHYSLPVMFVSNPGIVKPNNNVDSSTTEGEIKSHCTSKDAEGVNLPINKMKEEEKCSLNVPLVMGKTLQENTIPTSLAKTEKDKVFPLEFGMGAKHNQDKERGNIENILTLKRCSFSSETKELCSSPKKAKQLVHKNSPERPQVVCIQQTPRRKSSQPTLAAINSQANTDCSSAASQFFEEFGGMTPSSVNLSSTPGKDRGSLNTPNWLSPLGPSCIGLNTKTGFTPLKYDSDSGFFTPVKDKDFDFNFLLSPTQIAVKPSPRNKKIKEGCRKSLHLGTIKEDYSEGESLLDWLQI